MKQTAYNASEQQLLLQQLAAEFGDTITSKQISAWVMKNARPFPWFLVSDKYRISRGVYRLRSQPTVSQAVSMEIEATGATIKSLKDDFIPVRDDKYVPFGFYADLLGIIQSKVFYPVYITGLSGNGKTFMVEQACAQAQREFIRVNITKETDEFDLIGSYDLINGNTVWRDGPVLIAMRRGAILLLDETDYGSERLLCLQPVLEGKGYFNKKKGEFIEPAPGFNIMATANTKGKGSDDGRFVGANILNEAFLERFSITVEQAYPDQKTELNMLIKQFAELSTTPGMKTGEFASNLAKWADLIRKGYADGTVDEVISTRRLIHICKAYCIFKNRRKAIELCLNRFDDETKAVYLDFYSKIDSNFDAKIVEPPTKDLLAQAVEGLTLPNTPKMPPVPAPKGNAPVSPPVAVTNAPGARAAVSGNGYMSPTIFGDSRNIASVVAQYKVPVRVIRDNTTGDAVVKSHGQETRVPAAEIMSATYDVLEKYVRQHGISMPDPVYTGGGFDDGYDDKAPI